MTDDYKLLLHDYHLIRIENAKLERKLDAYEKVMRKYGISSVEKLDMCLREQRVW